MQSIPVVNQELQPTEFPAASKAVLIYASAHWCGPCRQFTPLLRMFYEAAKAAGAQIEIVFLSSDRTEREMVSYYKESHGKWLAVPFFSPQRQFLSSHFNIRGIPSLILLNKGTMQAVDMDVRGLVQQAAMMGSSDRLKSIVEELRERSGATLFDSIPSSMSSLTKEQRDSVFQLLSKIVANVADHPTESKYRQLKGDNATLKSSVLDLPCGDAPLRAVGFVKDSSGVFNYRPSFVDPFTAKQILTNRESNGLSTLAIAAPVVAGSTSVSPAFVAPVQSSIEAKFKVHYRNMTPQVADGIPVSEPLGVVSAIVESITEVPSEHQRLFCPTAQKEGDLSQCTNLQQQLEMALSVSSGGCLDLLVLGQHTRTNPLAPAESDLAANQAASELRAKIIELRGSNPSLFTAYNEAMQCQLYELPSNHHKALEVVPVMDLHSAAVAASRLSSNSSSVYEELLFKEVLHWFKTKFFSWTDKPRCSQCNALSTVLVNPKAPPTQQEAKGLATRTELYSCEVCGTITRFPRFNHPVALLATRTGRCGEWSNCFALIARALGFEVRRVHDSADHVWVEVWMEHRREWVHCDPCEDAYDKPLLYELGWGKATTLTIAVAKDGAADVTRRYCSDYESYSSKQRQVVGTPTVAANAIGALNELLMTHWACDPARLALLRERAAEEVIALNLLSQQDRKPKNLPGRTTGSVEWRRERGELGQVFIGDDNDEVCIAGPIGGNHFDTVPFSDENAVRTEIAKNGVPRLTKVSVWDDGALITGIACQWQSLAGELVQGASHLSTGAAEKQPTCVLELSDGEFINKLVIRTGSLLDFIEFRTNRGRCVKAGNDQGGQESEFAIKPGHHLIGFFGGMGGHIHNIGLLSAPLLVTDETSPTAAVSENAAPITSNPTTDAEKLKTVFTQLVAEGMSPNDAAVEALKRIK